MHTRELLRAPNAAEHAAASSTPLQQRRRGNRVVEVDANDLLQRPLLGVERRAPRFPPDAAAETVPLLALEEIAAGKFTALLTRGAAGGRKPRHGNRRTHPV